MSGEIEARTHHGWVKARVITQRANGTVRVETANHVEYEVTMQDIRAIPPPTVKSSSTVETKTKSAPQGSSSALQEKQPAGAQQVYGNSHTSSNHRQSRSKKESGAHSLTLESAAQSTAQFRRDHRLHPGLESREKEKVKHGKDENKSSPASPYEV